MNDSPETMAPEIGEPYHFHGSRVADIAEHPIVTFDHEHPDGRTIRPPEDGTLSIARCERCYADFYRYADSAVRVCRRCHGAIEDAANTRAAAPWIEAIGADGNGLATDIAHTGGNCRALVADLGGGPCSGTYTGSRFYAMITHAEDASVPDVGSHAYVGIYDGLEDDGCGYPEDGGPMTFTSDSPEAVADFCFAWADRLRRLDTASADDLTAWGIDPGRREGFGSR